tara:strand:- start:54 stop:2501 length:2448 start_codon:yes stop_codon:yes gene_type:complete
MDLDSLLKSIREENKGGAIVPAKFFGEDRYDKYYTELVNEGRIDGENISPDERKAGARAYRKGKIDFETFVNNVLKTRDEIKKQGEEQYSSNLDLPALPGSKGSAIIKRDSVNIEKFKSEPVSEGTQQNFDDILNGIDSILETLREDNKLKKKESKQARQKDEEKKRKKQENKLEKSPFKKLGGVVDRMLKPVKGIWERIWDFIWNVFLGRTLLKIVDWLSDPENKGKLDAIAVFLKNTWPGLLAAFIAFGTGLGGFITGLIGLIGGFIPRLMGLIPKMLKGLKTVALGNPLATAAVAVTAGTAIAAIAANKDGSAVVKDEKDPDKSHADEIREAGGMTGAPMSGDMFSDLPEESPQEFKEGGQVPGRGPNKDTVRAMLAPGEFVMSQGAVQKYGTDTLESMNAAGGGNNKPQTKGGTVYAKGGGSINTKPEETQSEVPRNDEEASVRKTTSEELKKSLSGEETSDATLKTTPLTKEQLLGKSSVMPTAEQLSATATKRHAELMKSTDPKKIADYDAKHGDGAYSKRLQEKLNKMYSSEMTKHMTKGMVKPTGKVVGRENLSPEAKAAISRLEAKEGLPPDMQYTKNGKKISADNFNRVKGMVDAAKEGGAKGVLNHVISGAKGMFGGVFDKVQDAVNDPKSFVESMGGTVKDGNIGKPTAQEQKDFDTLAASKEKLKQSQQNLLGIQSPKKPQDDPLFAEYQEAFDNPKHPLHDKVAGDLFADDKPSMRFADFKKLKAEQSQAKLSPNQSPPPAPPEPPSQSQPSVSHISATQKRRDARRGTSSKKYSGEANSIGPKHTVPRESSKAKTLGALV